MVKETKRSFKWRSRTSKRVELHAHWTKCFKQPILFIYLREGMFMCHHIHVCFFSICERLLFECLVLVSTLHCWMINSVFHGVGDTALWVMFTKKKHGFPNLVSNHRQEKEHIILCGVAERTHTHQWNVNYIICINRHIRAHIAGKNRREYITHSCLFVLWVFFFYSCQVDATCGVALNLCRIKRVCLAGVIWKQGIALLGHLTFAAFQSEHSFSIY